jgi:hypothetical protein
MEKEHLSKKKERERIEIKVMTNDQLEMSRASQRQHTKVVVHTTPPRHEKHRHGLYFTTEYRGPQATRNN